MGSDYSKTTHVCFKVERSLTAVADDELPRVLERQLGTRFDSVKMKKMPFMASWAFVLQMKQKPYSAVLGRSKYADDEWLLLVSPPNTPDASELIVVCREIHALVTAIANVTAVRWYFEGPHNQTAAVATPDELPWTGP
jgi:hypothetical protein